MPTPAHNDLTWLHIRKLRLNCMVGVHKWEQHIPQSLYLDLELAYRRQSGHQDNIRRVSDYSKIAQSISRYCQGRKFHLLESWMDGISAHIFESFPSCLQLRLSLSKPGALENAEHVTLSCSYPRPAK